MDTWDFFYLLTNRNQRKPFSAPNCSNKWKTLTEDGRELLPKKNKTK